MDERLREHLTHMKRGECGAAEGATLGTVR